MSGNGAVPLIGGSFGHLSTEGDVRKALRGLHPALVQAMLPSRPVVDVPGDAEPLKTGGYERVSHLVSCALVRVCIRHMYKELLLYHIRTR